MPIPKKEEGPQRLTAKNVIYKTLCDWITSGILQPGEKIVDTEIAQYFGVSRTPVREALQILESQKLIATTPGKSTTVAEIDMLDIEKSYRPLACIQALATELACAQLNDKELAELETTHEAFANACKHNRAEEAIERDNAFHGLILRAAGNEYIVEFSSVLLLHIQRIKYHYFHCNTLRSDSVKQHLDILEALKARDAQKASRLMQEHWLFVMDRSIHDVIAAKQEPDAQNGSIIVN